MKFKSQAVEGGFENTHEKLKGVALLASEFCEKNNRSLVITETSTSIEQDKVVGRKSVSHRQGRAIDIRTKDWDEAFIKDFLEFMETSFGHLGAFNLDGERRLCVYGDARHLDHIHVQLDRRFIYKR